MKYSICLFVIAVALIAAVNANLEGASPSEEEMPIGRPKNCATGTSYINKCNTCMCGGDTEDDDVCTRMGCDENHGADVYLAPSFATVKRWYNEFNHGRRLLNDKVCEGRPKSVVPENIDAVQKLIMQDCHATYCEIEAILGISSTSIYKILYDYLTMKKVCSRWIILHQDNASAHSSHQTTEYLKAQRIKLIGHLPYSPDLAANDFFLLPNIKNKLLGQRFSLAEEAVDTFKNVLEVSQEDWNESFGSNGCKGVLIIKENTLKNNKAVFNLKLLSFNY